MGFFRGENLGYSTLGDARTSGECEEYSSSSKYVQDAHIGLPARGREIVSLGLAASAFRVESVTHLAHKGETLSAAREQHTHTILVLQPDENCGPDRIAAWSAAHGVDLAVYNMGVSTEMPSSLDGYDGLIVLGGDMGDRDTAEYPWLEDMRERLREAHRTHVPALGVCLGAQLLASALGGEVELGEPGLETGVVDIRVTDEGARDPLLQGISDVFHSGSMHNDAVVRLPADAVLLARGDVYPHQAFRSGSTWAVQFHPEVSPASYERWVGLEDHSANPELQARFEASVEDFWRRDDLVAPECERLVGNFLSVVKGTTQLPAPQAASAVS